MEQVKKLYRSRKNRVIGGVCAGIAEHFSLDPIIVRILFVVLAIADGVGILLYIILWIVLPDENTVATSSVKEKIDGVAQDLQEGAERIAQDAKDSRWVDNKRNIVGLLVIAIGAILLINQFVNISWFKWDYLWPVIIIVIGFFFIIKNKK